ncbi:MULTISPECIES: transporter substrate-binding domain-containing protein [unclassified Sulfitobacter]|uniref:transporter substrate-binding domain-containing protein n=1 Tax=unclassified Sulfitobacter TaxID=196795 RepID=UPI0007C31AAD|nr:MULTISPECIES: transporter substrate-binding domain-containing protein [unclassified Sulfitobacter]KZY02809.1 amino acid ABC transporter [Sulfitobacter sp. HI0023]KZY22682.1 amino acid ABC transporter [Sulfitobacter sp. HI0040]KZZ67446.1 amino acid ABC transporter [Sulfitobacter sp. HI0129]
MKTILLATTALALTAGTAFADAHMKTVRLGTEGAYPPYNFLDDNGEVAGFERELGDELCVRAELTCEWVTNDWDSIIPNLVSGNYDVIIAGMSITDERDEVIDFSDPYTQPDPSAFIAMSDDVDMSNAVIAAQSGTIQASHIASMDGATLVEFATPEETIAAVKNGEADAVLADKAFLEPIAEAEADLSIVGDDVLLGGGIGLGIRESDGELREKFNAAIQSMKDDGTLNELIVKHLPGSATF